MQKYFENDVNQIWSNLCIAAKHQRNVLSDFGTDGMQNSDTAIWCDKHLAGKIIGLSTSTLKQLRLNGEFIENIHYVKYSKFCIRYNAELLRDWVTNRNTERHTIAIENYLNSLPSNQKRVGKKAKTPPSDAA